MSIFFYFPLWRVLRRTKGSVKEEHSGCLDLHTFYMSVGSGQHFFLESIETCEVSCSWADIYSCLLYLISFRRQNNVLICLFLFEELPFFSTTSSLKSYRS